jgi:UDP-N-acetylglucosamine--N-acetylmuramyl-(pentapeptide) pyrophosphoryl-undecaprenol N-acetylglucosamine transferase
MIAPTAIFAGGGSGGHLFPNIAIAERLRERFPDLREVYLVSDRDVDARIAEQEGLEAIALPAKPLAASPKGLVRFITNWGPSVRAARRAIREAKSTGPVALIASGGFVSAPAVMAARAEGAWSCLVNLDASLGKANRLAARFTPHRFVVSTSAPAGWTGVAPVVREAFDRLPPASEARSALGLDADRPTLLVTGGSQGAASLSRGLAEVLGRSEQLLRGWQALHQASARLASELRAAYERAGVAATITPFIERMPEAWAAADLAIGRGGAGTVGEAWASRTPLIALPYPHHRDAHQAANVRAMVDGGAARVVIDRIEPSKTAPDLERTLRETVENLQRFRGAASKLPPAAGAQSVATAAARALAAGSEQNA